MHIPDLFWQDHFKIAIFGQFLIGDGDVRVKTLQILVVSF